MFSVIIREAVELVRNIYDRMPLMLKQEEVQDVLDWVRPNTSSIGIADRALMDVILKEVPV